MNFQEEFEIEDLVQVESPTTRAYRHPIYQKAMLDWDKVDSLQKAVEWHQQYTPGIAIEDYIHHYITKPTKTTK